MPRIALLTIIALGALLIVAAPAGAAARPTVPAPVSELAGPHFVVHYTATGGTVADRLSPEGAATVLADAETALAWYEAHGFPAPLADGDGKTDIYVFAVPIGPAAGRDEESPNQTSGYILLTPEAANLYAVAHELFHVTQFAIYNHLGFFSESSAEWAGQAVVAANGGSPPPNWFPDPQIPLDCLGAACSGDTGDYHASIFWEYLTERYGTGIVLEVIARDAVLGAADHQSHDLQALGEVLAAHGSSVSAALDGYALAAVSGQIIRPGVLPHAPAAESLFVADRPVAYAPFAVTVDHLAMKVIDFSGAADSTAPCAKATLMLRVGLPAGVPTQPVFVTYPAAGAPPASAVYPMAVSGTTATAEIPWATCASSVGALALPNASTTADGQSFTVQVGVSEPPPAQSTEAPRSKPTPPRVLGKARQRVGRLSIRVLAAEAATVRGQALVSLPHVRGPIRSRVAKAKAVAGRPLILRLKFAAAGLKRIESTLVRHPLRARILITVHGSNGFDSTLSKSVKLEP